MANLKELLTQITSIDTNTTIDELKIFEESLKNIIKNEMYDSDSDILKSFLFLFHIQSWIIIKHIYNKDPENVNAIGIINNDYIEEALSNFDKACEIDRSLNMLKKYSGFYDELIEKYIVLTEIWDQNSEGLIVDAINDDENVEGLKKVLNILSNALEKINSNHERYPSLAKRVEELSEIISTREVILKYKNQDLEKKETKKSGCFIATAAYGSDFASEVLLLKKYRDEVLNNNFLGRKFITVYYLISPSIANTIKMSELMRSIVRNLLRPIIYFVKKML